MVPGAGRLPPSAPPFEGELDEPGVEGALGFCATVPGFEVPPELPPTGLVGLVPTLGSEVFPEEPPDVPPEVPPATGPVGPPTTPPSLPFPVEGGAITPPSPPLFGPLATVPEVPPDEGEVGTPELGGAVGAVGVPGAVGVVLAVPPEVLGVDGVDGEVGEVEPVVEPVPGAGIEPLSDAVVVGGGAIKPPSVAFAAASPNKGSAPGVSSPLKNELSARTASSAGDLEV